MIGQNPLVTGLFVYFFQNERWVVGWDERERSLCHNQKQFFSTERLILSSVFINAIHYEIVTIDQKSRPTVDDRVDTLCVCGCEHASAFIYAFMCVFVYMHVSVCVHKRATGSRR